MKLNLSKKKRKITKNKGNVDWDEEFFNFFFEFSQFVVAHFKTNLQCNNLSFIFVLLPLLFGAHGSVIQREPPN